MALTLDQLKAALEPIISRLDRLDTRVDSLATSFAAAEACACAERANLAVRAANALMSLTTPLVPFATDVHGAAWDPDVAQPPTLNDLAVSGSESIPGHTGAASRSTWTRAKSRAFLKASVLGYADDVSDGEGEGGAKSRTLRMKVIEVVGGTFERVFNTVYSLK